MASRGLGMIVNDFPQSPLALPRFRDVHRALVTRQPLVRAVRSAGDRRRARRVHAAVHGPTWPS